MPHGEFVEWVAFSRIEPFGYERDDWHAALLASVQAETHRCQTKRKKPYQPQDFLLKFEKPQAQTWQSQLQFVEMLNAAFGGKDERVSRGDAETQREEAGE